MRIDRLSITNFCCFEQREFEFHPGFNLVVGVNGSGKSTLFKALSISLGTWFLGFKNKLDKRSIEAGEPRLAILLADGSWTLDGTQRMDGRVRKSGYDGKIRLAEQYPVEISTTGTIIGLAEPVLWTRSKESEDGNTRYGKASNLIKYAQELDSLMRKGEAVTLPLIACYGPMRLWQEPRKLMEESRITGPESLIINKHNTRLEGYRFSVDPRISVQKLIAWFARQAWMTFERAEETQSFKVVREAVLGCIEGAEHLFFDPQLGELMVSLKGHETQPFAYLSDGQRCMLALVADIAQKAEWLNPHLGDNFLKETPGVVLIDELDLHLHPKWQRRIIEDLRRTFPKIQFIATTHSPFLIQSLRDGKLIQLDGDTGEEYSDASLEDIAENIQGVEMPQKSLRFRQMMEAAEAYYKQLHECADESDPQTQSLKQRLDELSIPFSDDPAFAAFLKFERDTLVAKEEKEG
jgi:predicted ATP-binding protein involved in virulence